MKTLIRSVASVLVAATFVGCAGKPVAVGSRGPVPVAAQERTITAQACGFQLLLLIPIALNDRAERAYRALEAQAAGDFITDVQVQEKWTWGFVGTSYCTNLQARAIRPRVVSRE